MFIGPFFFSTHNPPFQVFQTLYSFSLTRDGTIRLCTVQGEDDKPERFSNVFLHHPLVYDSTQMYRYHAADHQRDSIIFDHLPITPTALGAMPQGATFSPLDDMRR